MRPLVVISRQNEASRNIKGAILAIESMEEEGGFWRGTDFDMAEYSGEIVTIEPAHKADYYIYASTHKSEAGQPCFTAHTPGNWGSAGLGGKERTLNIAMPSRLKAAVQELAMLSRQSLGWQVSLEADHHGPTIEKPVMFVEIGSTREQWGMKKAGEIAARAIVAAVRNRRSWPAYVGFGGSHYAPKFSPKAVEGEEAFGHIISGYALEKDGFDAGRLKDVIGKNTEAPLGAMIDWKGMKGEVRSKLIRELESAGVKWQRA
ncbi:MAG: hypothetical protein N3E51_00600 [Candidatus Micrarchaeota archaeon]|nr:hypothetical protein [Candidatus Micrarchaeota archaeon]